MKSSFLFVILFSLLIPAFSQKGFKLIGRAKAKYEMGHDRIALSLLSRAERMNYGFCGEAWIEANRSIYLLKAQMYLKQKQYQLARNSLDSISSFYNGDDIDSIKILSYQLEYGEDSLKRMVDSSLVNTKVECGEYDCFAIIPLTNGRFLRLKFNLFKDPVLYTADERQRAEIWLANFMKSNNFKFIHDMN